MPIYETGHARNIEHFQTMIGFVTGWGAAYDPTNAAIELAALQAKLTAANTAMDGVVTALATSKTAVNQRENAFTGLRKLTTRVVNFYASTGTAKNNVDDAQSLKRKIDGKRAEQVEDDPSTPEDESANAISASQQSYTQLVEHFDNLIELLSGDPMYNPNEVDLQVANLVTLSGNMKTANTSVMTSNVALSNSRIDRDGVMYAPDTGLVDLALTVKKYAKAAFGADAPQYQQVSGLEFTRPR